MKSSSRPELLSPFHFHRISATPPPSLSHTHTHTLSPPFSPRPCGSLGSPGTSKRLALASLSLTLTHSLSHTLFLSPFSSRPCRSLGSPRHEQAPGPGLPALRHRGPSAAASGQEAQAALPGLRGSGERGRGGAILQSVWRQRGLLDSEFCISCTTRGRGGRACPFALLCSPLNSAELSAQFPTLRSDQW
jgi:hypothetical protein